MNPNELFDHYRRTACAIIPTDARNLQGMFCIRKRIDGSYAAGHIQKASAERGQIYIHDTMDSARAEWVSLGAFAAGEILLLHSSGDMQAVFNMLCRNRQDEEAKTAATKEGS